MSARLNELIAASGERFYENARQGFVERPAEARQRKLEELNLKGVGQQQDLRSLQIQSEQNKAAEYEAGGTVREQERDIKEFDTSPEEVERKRAAGIASAAKDVEVVNQGLEESKQRISGLKTEAERTKAADAASKYSEIVLGAVSQGSTQDAVSYIATNKQALLDAGTPEEDQTIESILNATPEEQERLVGMLKAAQPSIITYNQEMGKLGAKAKAKGAGKTTIARKSNEAEVAQALAVVEDHPTLNDLPGRDDEAMATLATAVSNRAHKLVADTKDAGEAALDYTSALSLAAEEVASNKDQWLDAASTFAGKSEVKIDKIFPTGEVTRTVNGKSAVFDAATKQFIRWGK